MLLVDADPVSVVLASDGSRKRRQGLGEHGRLPAMRVLNTTQMREADRYTIHEIGIPSLVLMENAGRQVVSAMEAWFKPLADKRVAVVAGRGNNGGDGFVVARTLLDRVLDVGVFLIGRVQDVAGDARANLEILGRLGVSVVEVGDEQSWELHSSEALAADIVVDAIFGTGLKAPLHGVLQTVVADLNASGVPVVAVDVPSGLASDAHMVMGEAVQATLTVTMGAPKPAHVLPPASRHCGDLVVADIGIPPSVIDAVEGPRLEVVTQEMLGAHVEVRDPDAHKGDFGRILIVAGSMGKTGAAHLAAMGAIKSGAGLVTIATPRSCQPLLAVMAPEYMTVALPEDEEGRIIAEALEIVLAQPADVIAIGPGLGTSDAITTFLISLLEQSGVPLVLDADALNAFAADPLRLHARDGLDIIITPHPGEMARLLGSPTNEVQADRVAAARALAEQRDLHVILKGHRTLVASPDGAVSINVTGNPGMATGGTGDVLTGVVAAWLAQLLDPEAAARLAAYVHGLAGDLAQADCGEVAMSASDLLDHLGDAVLELQSGAGHDGRDEARGDPI
ncbi:MAG: NAD(P)H-hydrate dehydratase [Luteitalea sp.]|nr:NAD(P)H-hydrate dehydratase [Luteitalea sp.]